MSGIHFKTIRTRSAILGFCHYLIAVLPCFQEGVDCSPPEVTRDTMYLQRMVDLPKQQYWVLTSLLQLRQDRINDRFVACRLLPVPIS